MSEEIYSDHSDPILLFRTPSWRYSALRQKLRPLLVVCGQKQTAVRLEQPRQLRGDLPPQRRFGGGLIKDPDKIVQALITRFFL